MTNFRSEKAQSESPAASQDELPLYSPRRDDGLLIRFGACVAACALILWTGDSQSEGMIQVGPNLLQEMPTSVWSAFEALAWRLWPLLALAAVQYAFILSCAPLEAVNYDLITVESCIARHPRRICAGIIGTALILSLLGVWDLRAFPNSGDEYSYLFGARTFLAGRLWNSAPENPQFFATYHILIFSGKWVSKYEPGWAAILAMGHRLGLPFWAVNPILGAALLALIVKTAWRYEGGLAAAVAAALVGLSPFYVFMTASYFNSISAAVFGASFVYFALEYLERPRALPALCAGAMLGALGLVRPFDVFIFALPFAGALLLRNDRRGFAFAPLIVLGGCPFLGALSLYYDIVGGSPFVPLVKIYGPDLGLGLFPVLDSNGEVYGPGITFAEAVDQIVILAEWTSPMLVVLNAVAMIWRGRRRTLRFTDWIFSANVLLYMLHAGSGADQYGSRYYFESYPYFVLTIAAAADDLFRHRAGTRCCRIAAAAVLSHVAALSVNLVMLMCFMRPIIDKRMDLYDQVEHDHLENAIVILRSSLGTTDSSPSRNLTRNGIALSGSVIYALDPGVALPVLKSMFPHRKFYVYDRAQGNQRRTLRSLE
jgi:hypothetical protein